MKRILVVSTLALTVSLMTACGNTKGTVSSSNGQASQQTAQQGNGVNWQQRTQTPEMQLRRSVMEIDRIQRSDKPFTADQVKKLTPILNEIANQKPIDKTFSDKKSIEIKAVFTDEQKNQSFGRRRGDKNGGQWAGNTAAPGNMQNRSGNKAAPNQSQADNQMQPMQGGMRGPDGGKTQKDLKTVCQETIKLLSSK